MADLLRDASAAGPLAISAPVWTELHAAPGAEPDFIARFLDDTGVEVDFDLDERTWRRASAGSEPTRLLVDFLGGPNARQRAERLLTLDPQRYRQAFEDLRIEP